jgi:hypothetical protein
LFRLSAFTAIRNVMNIDMAVLVYWRRG